MFINLTKAFDLMCRDGLFKILPKIGCPPKVLSIIRSFLECMSTIQFDGEFWVKSGVKQGCELAPTFFGMFFAILLNHAFSSSEDGVYLHSRADSRLLTSLDFERKPRSGKSLLEICWSQTMLPWFPITSKDSKDSWTDFLTHGTSLDSPSVRGKRK